MIMQRRKVSFRFFSLFATSLLFGLLATQGLFAQVDTGAILTTAANSAIAPIHDRMPVVIKPEDFSRWLDCKTQEPREVADLMRPVEEDFFEAIPVSDKVNKVSNMGEDLQTPVVLEKPPKPAAAKPGDGQLSFF